MSTERHTHFSPSPIVLAKRHMMRPSFWLICASLLFLYALLSTIVLPDIRTTEVGILNGGGESAARIAEELSHSLSRYEYTFYTDEDDMRRDVSTGKLDCAFILDERLDGARAGSLSDRVTVITSTTSSKAVLVKEELFSVILEEISGKLLKSLSEEGSFFRNPSEETDQALEDTYRALLGSDEVLTVYFEDAETGERTSAQDFSAAKESGGNESGSAHEGASSGLSVLSVLLFGAALFFAAGRFREDSRGIRRALPRGTRFVFSWTDLAVPLFIAGILLTGAGVFSGTLSFAGLSALRTVCASAAGLALMALWALGFSSLFRKEAMYLFAVTAVLVLAAILSAQEAFAVGILTRQFGWLAWIFPTSWYTALIGI